MRQRLLNRHYTLLQLEHRIRAEKEWVFALEVEIHNKRRMLEAEAADVEKRRLELERILCPVQELPEKKERHWNRKEKEPETVEELIDQIGGMTSEQKELMLELLKQEEVKE